jgi:hypothetical protein
VQKTYGRARRLAYRGLGLAEQKLLCKMTNRTKRLRFLDPFAEPFTRGHLITFSLIWTALAIFTFDMVFRWRSGRVREGAMPLARPV